MIQSLGNDRWWRDVKYVKNGVGLIPVEREEEEKDRIEVSVSNGDLNVS